MQCEKCQLWFHFICIGVDPEELADADYYCFACESKAEIEASSDSELTQTVTADDIDVAYSDNEEDDIKQEAVKLETRVGHEDMAEIIVDNPGVEGGEIKIEGVKLEPVYDDYSSSQSEQSSQLSSASTQRFKPLKDIDVND